MTTRRTFLATSAAALAASAKSLSTIGVQLYTVRSVLPEKPLETLKALEQMGYRECEVVARDIDKIWPSLQQTALKPVSVHLDTALFMKDAAKLPAALEDAAKRGFRYVVCPYVAPADRGGAEVMKRLGETLNSAGQKAKAAGITLAYHNHAFEFEPAGAAGTLLDVLMGACDKKLVQLELDIMWVKVAGVDPVEMLKKYKGRVPLMHVKNLHPGVDKRYDERIPRTAFAEAGKGVIDIGSVLKAAGPAGVKHFFVEQDQTPGDPLASLKESFQYVRGLNF
ncbi:MAG: sugar phosphate isomerase/epimerase [Bryobacterales bacterium]|nr:sugar phosphate isomerase/epimerase [Bryobacterales bacterium]